MNNTMKVKMLTTTAKVPVVAHPGEDLGYDLFSDRGVVILPYEQVVVTTGIVLGFPTGYGGIIKDRSSMASKMVYTSAGVIDNGYQGEIKVLLRNDGPEDYKISAGDKIAQLILVEVKTMHEIIIVSELCETSRGDLGFGSTGK